MPLDDTSQPPPFDPNQPFTPEGGNAAAAPPPFDPTKPFTAAAPKTEAPEWREPPPEPQGSVEAPFEPRSKDEYETWKKTAPKGSVIKLPTGETWTQAETPPPPAPGLFGTAIEAGRKGIVQGVTEAAQAPTAFRDREQEAPDTSPVGKLLSQPISAGWSDPKWWVAHIVHGAAASAPSLALGAAGGVAGGAAGSAFPAVGTAIGALAGGAGGFALGSAIQTIAPAYQQARAVGLDHDAAVDRAMKETGIAAAFGAAMGVAPAVTPLKGALSRALAEIFAVQPGLGIGQQVATGAVEGHAPTWDQLGTAYAEQAGMGAAMAAGHAGARHLIGEHEVPGAATAQPTALGAPPEGVPPIGSTIGMPMGDQGVVPMTVDRVSPAGHIVLKDPDGVEHPMTPENVARLKTEPPASPEEASAAAQQPTTEPITFSATVPEEGGAPEDVFGLPRTQADIEQEDAEMRAATETPPATPDAGTAAVAGQLAADQQELADPTVPRGTETPATPPPAEPTTAQPPPTTEYSALDAYARAIDLLRRAGQPLTLDQVRSRLKLPRDQFDALASRLRQEGIVTADAQGRAIATAPPSETEASGGSPVQPQALAAPRQPETAAATSPAEPRSAEILPFPGAQQPLPVPEGGFRTERGSVYEVHDDGTTTRNKSYHPEHGPEDVGLKPRSEKTIYVDPSVAANLSGAGLSGPDKFRLGLKDGKASLIWPNNRTGQWGTSDLSRDIPFSETPQVGLAPVEAWGRTNDVPGYETYSGQHAGNAITEMAPRGPEPANDAERPQRMPIEEPTAAPEAPEAAPEPPPFTAHDIRNVEGGERPPVTAEREPEFERPQRMPIEEPAAETPPEPEVTPQQQPAAEPSPNEPRVIEGNHTKTGAPIVTVQLGERVSKEDFKRLHVEARRLGGYYSPYNKRGALPGFIFKDRATADRFAEIVRGETPAPTRGTRHPEAVTEDVEQAREETNPEPSDAQKESGVYAKGRVSYHGLPFVIETSAGEFREGPKGPDGQPAWRAQMPPNVDYGYVRYPNVRAADGDHPDMFLGPHHDSQRAWVIDQVHADTKTYDEPKILAGFNEWPEAKGAYEASFSDGRGADRIGNATEMSLDELKDWLKNGDTKNPIGTIEPRAAVEAEPLSVEPREAIAARDLGPPGDPRVPKVNTSAPTESALEASLTRADAARNRPTLSRAQRAEAENVRAETARRFDEAIAEARSDQTGTTPSNWLREAETYAAQSFPAAPGKEPTQSRRDQRRGFMEAVRFGKKSGDYSGRDFSQGYREGETWALKNPRPDVGTIPVTLTTARGRETRLDLPRDPEIIQQVKERYTNLDPGLLYGLAEEGPQFTAPKPERFQDRFDEFESRYPWHEMDPHEAAASFVRDLGQETGNEHVAAYDARLGRVVAAGTSNQTNFVAMPRVDNPSMTIIHHNHPSGNSLSRSDLEALTQTGIHQVVAHAGDDVFAARLTPAMAAEPEMLPLAISAARNSVIAVMQPLVDRGRIDTDSANRVFADLVNRALAHAGIIDYMSTRDPAGLMDARTAERVIRTAAERVKRGLGDDLPFLKGSTDGFSDRSARTVRPEGAMDEIRSGSERLAGGIQTDPSVLPRDEGRARRFGEGAGLAEERPPDLSDEAEKAVDEAVPRGTDSFDASQRQTLEQADRAFDGGRGGGGAWNRVLRTFGVGRNAPTGDYWFNAINRDLTTPLGLARLDPRRSGAKMAAEDAKNDSHNAYLYSYAKTLDPFLKGSQADVNRALAAMELLTLEGREVPADGRAVVAENNSYPLARLSKVGEDVSLLTPEQIKIFGAISDTMSKAWDDRIAAVAKVLGWQGEPTYGAIMKAAEEASGREAVRLQKTAAAVAAVQYNKRAAYLPLARRGDYYLMVRPKAGTPDRPGIPGWTENGFPPTSWFELIDSRTLPEKIIGGRREGTPKTAEAAIIELRKTFPEDQYEITHDYMFHKADAIKDLPISAVEKLMVMVGNDVRSEYMKGRSADAADKEYNDALDSVLQQVIGELKPVAAEKIREARVAGPLRERKSTPGYDEDFAESIGRYLNWGAWSVASLEHGDAIRAADLAIHGGYDDRGAYLPGHPDPQVRDYWTQYDRRHESPVGPLASALWKARQGAFYWALAGNAASTVKIALHGPMLGMNVLGTGLGALGRSKAIADYMVAATKLTSALRVGKDGLDLDLMKGAHDDGERRLLQWADEIGLTHPHGMQELAAVSHEGEDALKPQQQFNRRVLTIWSSNISAADRLIRGAMLLSAYRTAQREGMDTINRVWDRDGVWQNTEKTPENFARFMVDRAAGRWGIDNRMPVARSLLGGMMMQFRAYEANWLSTAHQLMWHMGPEGKVSAGLMLAGLGLTAGAVGLPFAQDAEKAYEGVYKLVTGVDPNLEEHVAQYFHDDPLGIGADIGKSILYGTQPFGIDLGGLGFGDIVGRQSQTALDMAGAAASIFLGAPYRAYERGGQSALAQWAELMPTSLKNLVRAYGVIPEEGVRTLKGDVTIPRNRITEADQAKAAAGFRPAAWADVSRENERAYRLSQAQRDAAAHFNRQLKTLEESLVIAQQRGDGPGARDIEQKMQTLYQNTPPGVKVSAKTLHDAALRAYDPEAFNLQRAPKIVRPQIAQPLYSQPQRQAQP